MSLAAREFEARRVAPSFYIRPVSPYRGPNRRVREHIEDAALIGLEGSFEARDAQRDAATWRDRVLAAW